jgi:hypothetical protein
LVTRTLALDEPEDDERTILHVPAIPDAEPDAGFGDSEITRAISILGDKSRPITIRTRAVPSRISEFGLESDAIPVAEGADGMATALYDPVAGGKHRSSPIDRGGVGDTSDSTVRAPSPFADTMISDAHLVVSGRCSNARPRPNRTFALHE